MCYFALHISVYTGLLCTYFEVQRRHIYTYICVRMPPQVRVNYIKLGGYVALCLGAHNLHQNTAVYPVAHYNAFCYTSQVP